MAFNNITNLSLGNLLQTVFTHNLLNQISVDFRDFEMIKRAKAKNSIARELKFMFQTSLGAAAIQYADPGTANAAFPDSQLVSTSEYTALMKEIRATIELPYSVYDRARKNPEKYAAPLAVEMQAKTSASKRRLAADLYADGTGVIGTVASAAVTSPTSDKLVFTLSATDSARGHVGFFEYEDILVLKAAAGGASALDTSLATEPVYWKVIEKDFDNGTVTLQGLTTAGASVGTIASITVQPTAGDVFYRRGQSTIPDLTSTISDYGTATQVIAGLESLVANDGRVIHGITMSGANAGSRLDCGANPLDVRYIQRVMSKVKRTVGQDRYTWKMAIQSPESLDALIESREVDRRFNTMEDATKGTKKFMYQHQNDSLEMYTSEYVPQKRLYILPEAKAGEKVIEFHGTEFETVKGEDMTDFHLKAGSSGYVNAMQSFLQATGVLVCNHPAAVAVLHNFTNT